MSLSPLLFCFAVRLSNLNVKPARPRMRAVLCAYLPGPNREPALPLLPCPVSCARDLEAL
jgi:hypothetical protein